jgi:hypothetical protein
VTARDDLEGAAGISMRAALEDDDQAAQTLAAEGDEPTNRVSLRDQVAADAQPPIGPGEDPWEIDVPPMVARYLKGDETRAIPVRLHMSRLLVPGLVTVGGLALAAALNGWAYAAHHATGTIVHPIWWAWLAGLGWSAWRYLEWRQTWFVVTGHRIMTIQAKHLIGRDVTMLPIPKLRDLAYRQTPLGRVLGYATFDFASIGTEKALDLVRFVPYPEWMYQRITELIMPEIDRRAVKRTGAKPGGS